MMTAVKDASSKHQEGQWRMQPPTFLSYQPSTFDVLWLFTVHVRICIHVCIYIYICIYIHTRCVDVRDTRMMEICGWSWMVLPNHPDASVPPRSRKKPRPLRASQPAERSPGFNGSIWRKIHNWAVFKIAKSHSIVLVPGCFSAGLFYWIGIIHCSIEKIETRIHPNIEVWEVKAKNWDLNH